MTWSPSPVPLNQKLSDSVSRQSWGPGNIRPSETSVTPVTWTSAPSQSGWSAGTRTCSTRSMKPSPSTSSSWRSASPLRRSTWVSVSPLTASPVWSTVETSSVSLPYTTTGVTPGLPLPLPGLHTGPSTPTSTPADSIVAWSTPSGPPSPSASSLAWSSTTPASASHRYGSRSKSSSSSGSNGSSSMISSDAWRIGLTAAPSASNSRSTARSVPSNFSSSKVSIWNVCSCGPPWTKVNEPLTGVYSSSGVAMAGSVR